MGLRPSLAMKKSPLFFSLMIPGVRKQTLFHLLKCSYNSMPHKSPGDVNSKHQNVQKHFGDIKHRLKRLCASM